MAGFEPRSTVCVSFLKQLTVNAYYGWVDLNLGPLESEAEMLSSVSQPPF